MHPVTPLGRTVAVVRLEGWIVEVVERTCKFPGRPIFKQDYLGVIDAIAIRFELDDMIGLQATTRGNLAAHVKKAIDSTDLVVWLSAPSRRYEIWGWGKIKAGRREHWSAAVVSIGWS